ncbi:hypothetical protein GobsT_62020 [Gemmata obscuriglobus]|uniref:Uncharacterized protein n=1 Tax=Gemmata obscuriglobus TaxID=114 RepID=A0A2Z3H355_9BACT|nr:hypothetical protein [Gemmata obscuriglobus]AWM36044.1 hypothetical protein C1280_02820 [Gemmata obscuriglobus]QEG31381.1 hypothetical protein GobsT_62020 [Gemmata obscuriglobus]VTS10721.1 unnamed protein product [Gemmata obscuriglobus UQM 2246]
MFRKLLPPVVVQASLIAAGEWLRANGSDRSLSAAELEAHLRSRFELRELTLDPQPNGRFEGTGVGNKGERYRFSATQTSATRTVVTEYKGTSGADTGYTSLAFSTTFSDNRRNYLLLAFGCLISVGKVLRDVSRSGALRSDSGSI